MWLFNTERWNVLFLRNKFHFDSVQIHVYCWNQKWKSNEKHLKIRKKYIKYKPKNSLPKTKWKCAETLLTLGEFKMWIIHNEISHYITCPPVDPLQWMGAVRMRVQTADKKHHIFWNKKLLVCKKQIRCLQAKYYESSILNFAVLSEKVISSESGEKYAQIKHFLQAKTVQNIQVGGFWCERATRYKLFFY